MPCAASDTDLVGRRASLRSRNATRLAAALQEGAGYGERH